MASQNPAPKRIKTIYLRAKAINPKITYAVVQTVYEAMEKDFVETKSFYHPCFSVGIGESGRFTVKQSAKYKRMYRKEKPKVGGIPPKSKRS